MKPHTKIYVTLLLIPLLVIPISAEYAVQGEFELLDGTSRSFSHYEGEILLIEAVSMLCAPCVQENYRGNVTLLYDEYSDDVTFLTLSRAAFASVSSVEDFRDENNIEWDIGIDEDNILSGNLSLGGSPSLLLLDSEGMEINRQSGSMSSNFTELSLEIDTLLASLTTDEPTTSESSTESASLAVVTSFITLTILTVKRRR